MKISIISGSPRSNAQSSKIARFIAESLSNMDDCSETYLLDLANNPLPLWDESIWAGDEAWQQPFTPISDQLSPPYPIIILSPSCLPPVLWALLLIP